MNAVKLRKTIGANLQAARKAKHYTQEDVAKAVGVTTNYYATLERGVAIASIETMYDIIVMLKVKASDIFPDKA